MRMIHKDPMLTLEDSGPIDCPKVLTVFLEYRSYEHCSIRWVNNGITLATRSVEVLCYQFPRP